MNDKLDGEMVILHVYPQQQYHDDVRIIGEACALRRLAAALMEAADEGASQLTTVMTGDGEGYNVTIVTATDQTVMHARLPYAQPGLPWDYVTYEEHQKALKSAGKVQS